jgi:Flp pilus assembly protein TadG
VTRLPPTPQRQAQRGAATVELVVVAPVLVVLLLFVVLAGRVVVAMGDLEAAARDAARAASQSRSALAARQAAEQAAAADLAQTRRVTCQTLQVQTDTTRFTPHRADAGPVAGTVSVTLRCQLNLADLSLLGLGGTRLVQRRAVAPVDAFRGVSLGFVNSEGSSSANSRVVGADG